MDDDDEKEERTADNICLSSKLTGSKGGGNGNGHHLRETQSTR